VKRHDLNIMHSIYTLNWNNFSCQGREVDSLCFEMMLCNSKIEQIRYFSYILGLPTYGHTFTTILEVFN
jgi:phosphatidylinositol kinase/protein kinase (PI-3  family)